MNSSIEPWVREVLRCPACKAELTDVEGGLRCQEHGTYPIRDGIPVLLVDEAQP